MSKTITQLFKKANPEISAPDIENVPDKESADFLSSHLGRGLAGAGVGGGLAALLSSRVKNPGEEGNPAARRRRVLRDALIGAGLVGGSTAALSYGLENPTTDSNNNSSSNSISNLASKVVPRNILPSIAASSGFFWHRRGIKEGLNNTIDAFTRNLDNNVKTVAEPLLRNLGAHSTLNKLLSVGKDGMNSITKLFSGNDSRILKDVIDKITRDTATQRALLKANPTLLNDLDNVIKHRGSRLSADQMANLRKLRTAFTSDLATQPGSAARFFGKATPMMKGLGRRTGFIGLPFLGAHAAQNMLMSGLSDHAPLRSNY